MRTFFCVLGMLVMGWFCFKTGRDFVMGCGESYALYHYDEWQTTEAKITSYKIDVDAINGFEVNSRVKLEYTYVVDGTLHTNKKTFARQNTGIIRKLHLGDNMQWKMEKNRDRRAILPPDAHVEVSYHPDIPSLAFLDIDTHEATVTARDRLISAGISFLLCFICASFFCRCLTAVLGKKIRQVPPEELFADEVK